MPQQGMLARLDSISVRYNRGWVLRGVTATVAGAEGVMLTGGNGSGKTTLLRILATLLTPSHGHFELCGMQGGAVRQCRRSVAFLSHPSHLYSDLSGAENLDLAWRLQGRQGCMSPDVALQKVGLTEAAAQAVGTYSAGMKRRLMLARVLLRPIKLLLLDEPFGQLDTAGIALMQEVIGELQKAGTAIVMATHMPELARNLVQTHWQLEQGRLRVARLGQGD